MVSGPDNFLGWHRLLSTFGFGCFLVRQFFSILDRRFSVHIGGVIFPRCFLRRCSLRNICDRLRFDHLYAYTFSPPFAASIFESICCHTYVRWLLWRDDIPVELPKGCHWVLSALEFETGVREIHSWHCSLCGASMAACHTTVPRKTPLGIGFHGVGARPEGVRSVGFAHNRHSHVPGGGW